MNEITDRYYNLVDEAWIPVADRGLASLRQIFSDYALRALGGNPVQKIAITKLLLAIAQAAYTPKDETEWETIGYKGMSEKTLQYLDSKKDCFWLYGDKPFLQMPEIIKAELQVYGAVQPFIATGNTTVLHQSQIDRYLTDAERALLVITLMSFALGGKKTDNRVVLSYGYSDKTNEKGKPSTGKPGPSLGFLGYLHSFVVSDLLLHSIWLNLMTFEDVNKMSFFKNGIGNPPWETMPLGENCDVAKQLQNSYMGRLIPVNRFILLKKSGIHYSEGISHPTHKEGGFDLSIAVNVSKEPKAIWVDPEKRPWRQITALLSFFASKSKSDFDCLQLRICVKRACKNITEFGVWSGGIKVSSNAGEQYVSGTDDFVESEVKLNSGSLGESWFNLLKTEMSQLDELSKIIYASVMGYFKSQLSNGKNTAGSAVNLFWQLCEQQFQNLIDDCYDIERKETIKLHKAFAGFAQKAFNAYCPRETARQLDAWAANKPNFGKYISSK